MNLIKSIVLLVCLLANTTYAQEVKTLMLKLEVSDTTYRLVDAWLIPRAFPATATLQKPSEGALNWDISSSSGVILAKGIIADPQVIRAHFAEADKFSRGQSRLEKTTVVIRVPYNSEMQKLSIERTPIIYLPLLESSGTTKSQKLTQRKHDFLITPREIK
ncbi:hypothetical protein [Cellvibrio sp.]|uniref:hypothetical protein n=1 Tax=Cellvibrio sp. TaxID=1965322 RepID=UPI0039647ACF